MAGELAVPAPPAPDLPAARSFALAHRPSLRAAEHTVATAERRTALEQARRARDVSPYVGLRRVAESNTVLFGIAIPLPVFDRNQGGIARAQAEEKAAQVELEIHRRRVLTEVDAAGLAWERARARVAAFDTGLLRPADELATIAREAYREDAMDLLGFLEARRTRVEVRRQYLRALFEASAAHLAIEQAIGRDLPR